MRRLIHIIAVCIFVCACVSLISCKDQQLTTDTEARIAFSVDTIQFDTVFTDMGSSTRQVMLYNPNPNAIRISRAWWKNGKCFYANIDGENSISRWQDIDILGGDSLFLFVRVQIDPYDSQSHPIEVDTLFFEVNGHRQYIAMQAYGMNVERIKGPIHLSGYHFTADKPYLIYDSICIHGPLQIDAGATLYMHNNACLVAYGNVSAIGTEDQPIQIMGDRTDYLFDRVPYRVASGQWSGLYFYRLDSLTNGKTTYDLEHIHILSGQVGLYCYSDNKDERATLYLHNARVHNMAMYGVALENTDAKLCNTEISNCASYGLYLAGGQHRVEHSTIANYFGYPYTTLNIHSTSRKSVPSVYILASSLDMAPSISSIYNSIITGANQPALVVDSVSETGYAGRVAGCYLIADTLAPEWAHSNTYAHSQDTVFKNIYYRYGEYKYYDFQLSESSKARGIGLPLDSLLLDIHQDMQGRKRDDQHPDAGCYCYQ